MVVISTPYCHFCQNAVRDIAGVPRLQLLMKRYSRWLMPQDGAIPSSAVAQWNAAHPAETMTLAYRESEWPRFDTWETPTFYFFKKSTLVAKMTGWAGAGRTADLERALHSIGAN